jgi:acetyl esterase/lipase
MYRGFLSYLTKTANVNIVSVDYRLTPENHYPAALDDVYTTYKWFIETGVDLNRLVIAGYSAGGNLVVGLLQKIRDNHLPMPVSAVLICPWLDLSDNAIISEQAAKYDKIIPLEYIIRCKDEYAPGEDRKHPLISPINADTKGFPPLYIQTGTGDTLSPQALEFENRARQQGVDVVCDVWKDMPHDWQVLLTPLVKESRDAIKDIATYINESTKKT